MSFKRSSKKTKKKSKSLKQPLIEESNKKITNSSIKMIIDDKNVNNINSSIPKYEYINKPAFTSVIFTCKKDQSIVADGGKMNYMDNDFQVKTSSRGGIMKGFKRLFTSSSMFQNEFKALKDNSKICFSNFLNGDMFSIKINPNDRITVGSYALVCMSNNIQIQTRFRFKGLFTKENPFISDIIVDKKSSKPGMAWLSSYGGYKKIFIEEGKSFLLNAGLFLAAQSHVRYNITTVGGLKASFLSGEDLMMRFVGPADIYIHTRDIKSLEKFIISKIPSKRR